MTLASPSGTENTGGESRGTLRVQNAFAAVILVLFCALAWQGREPTGLSGSDELQYRALSQSLEHGTYREIFQVGAPLAVKYPPAYPAWLLVLRTVTGDHLDGVRIANTLFVALALLMLFGVVRTLGGGWLALAVLLPSAINPYLLEFAGSMMSEAMYVFMSVAAVVAMFKAERARRWAVPAAMAFTLLAFLTRSAGLTLVVTTGVWFALRRPRSELLVYVVASMVVIGAWFSYAALAPHEGAASYGRDLGDAGVTARTSAVPAVVGRAARAAIALGTTTTTWTLSLPTIAGTKLDNLAWIIALFTLIPLGLFVLWRAWVAVPVYLVMYAGLMVAWPYPSDRLLGVVAPLLFLALLLGAHTALRRVPVPGRAAALGALLALVVLGNARRAAERYEDGARCDRAHPYLPDGCYDVRALGLIRASEALRAHSADGDMVVSSKGASVHYLSGRLTMPARLMTGFAGGTLVDTLRARRFRHVILTLYSDGADGALAESMLPRCHEFGVEADYLPAALLLSVLPVGQTSDAACAAVPRFVRGFGKPHPL
jgi:hypothetical protein